MKKYILLFALISSAAVLSAQKQSMEPVDYVDPLMGTSSPQWTLFPGASTPSGMVKISPDNQLAGWKAGYDYNIESIAGFCHIHSRTMGGLLVMPVTGRLNIFRGNPEDPDSGYRSRFSHRNEKAQPGYYSVILDDYNIKAELTSTTRAAFQKYTYPESDTARLLIDLKIPTSHGYEITGAGIRKVSSTEIAGFSIQQSLMGAEANRYTIHFVIRLSKPFKSFNGWIGDRILRNAEEINLSYEDKGIGVFLDFSTKDGEEILVQSGLSLVSVDQARLNLETELGPFAWDFTSVREKSRDEWNRLLKTILVEGGDEENLKLFYTSLYRAFAGQTTWSDVNGMYVDMDEKVQVPGNPDYPVYGCDPPGAGAIALFQLRNLCQPDLSNKCVLSLLETGQKGGWLPEAAEGVEYPATPVVSYGIPMMASAYQQGIRNYDTSMMYKAVVHDLSVAGAPHRGGGFAGVVYLEPYLKTGIAGGTADSAAITCGYSFTDWTAAQMAKRSGNIPDFRTFTKRAFNYKNVPPRENKPLSAFVPHDVNGLLISSGRENFIRKLEESIDSSLKSGCSGMTSPDLIKAFLYSGDYRTEQHPLQAAWLFNYTGQPWLTQKLTRDIMTEYRSGKAGAFNPCIDPAQAGALFVMSAIGLFQTDGGTSAEPFYEIGSPLFEKITIRLDNKYYRGNEFVIKTVNNSAENKYIRRASLNRTVLNKPWFRQADLAAGGMLELVMGPVPNLKWGSNPADSPPSMSTRLTPEETKTIMAYDKYAEDLAAWNQALRAYYYHKKEHFESLPNTPNEIIFLGNSITDNCEWWELFSNPNIKNRGIGGDDTDGILERLDEVTESNPSKIFIMIGTNDLSNGKSVEYIVGNYRRIIERIRQSSPGTRIYIQSVLPTDDGIHYTRRNTEIIRINDHLKDIATENGLTYIDLFNIFQTENHKLNPQYSIDGLHLNGRGYLLWKDAIIKYVEE
ncbi:MAG TPA: GH92 family glycosyl hydrolase [Bacteroidales bacterium]|nr:GH92 family glycosyl hydrolase [Bacteroidales bacterium]